MMLRPIHFYSYRRKQQGTKGCASGICNCNYRQNRNGYASHCNPSALPEHN